MNQVCRWGPKNLISIGTCGGGAATHCMQPMWSMSRRKATEHLGSDGDLEMKLMCSVTPVIYRHLQQCFRSARCRIRRGSRFLYSSEIEDPPVMHRAACTT
jgi:hypothetical protein